MGARAWLDSRLGATELALPRKNTLALSNYFCSLSLSFLTCQWQQRRQLPCQLDRLWGAKAQTNTDWKRTCQTAEGPHSRKRWGQPPQATHPCDETQTQPCDPCNCCRNCVFPRRVLEYSGSYLKFPWKPPGSLQSQGRATHVLFSDWFFTSVFPKHLCREGVGRDAGAFCVRGHLKTFSCGAIFRHCY